VIAILNKSQGTVYGNGNRELQKRIACANLKKLLIEQWSFPVAQDE